MNNLSVNFRPAGITPGSTPSTAAKASASEELAQKLLSDKVDPSCREKLLQDLSSLPAPMLQKLYDGEVRICTVENKVSEGKKDGGCFRPLSKEVAVDVTTYNSDDGRAVLCHELGHAIDFGRVPSGKTLKDRLAFGFFNQSQSKEKLSEQSPELGRLYQNFQAKTLADLASEARTEINKNLQPGEGDQLIGKNLHTTMFGDGAFLRQPGNKDDLLVFQHDTHRVRNGLVKLGLGAATVIGSVLTGGLVGVAIGAAGLYQLGSGARQLVSKPQSWSQDVDGMQVKNNEKATSVQLPKNAEASKIGWTQNANYVSSTQLKEELFAEGVSAFLTSPESREKLAHEEPELYQFIHSSLDEYMIAPHKV